MMDNLNRSHSLFDAKAEFLLFDSEHLQEVKTKMYGYSVQENGIFEQENLTPQAIADLDGCGCYVYVETDQNQITIKQDYNGCWGLYLYEEEDFFSLSSSFYLLLEHIKKRTVLTLNRDYCNEIFAEGLSSLAYEDTPVKEIRLLPPNVILHIDKSTKKLVQTSTNYQGNFIEIDSPEGIHCLDSWFSRWTRIIRCLSKSSAELMTDLSGGFDSRLSFLLMLKSGIDLNSTRIFSIEDDKHTYIEDYAIASEIANRFGFSLNKPFRSNQQLHYSPDDAINISYYTKMAFHKEMLFTTTKSAQKVFVITGSGGEGIRARWNAGSQELVEQNMHRANRYRDGKLRNEVQSSIEKILKKNNDIIQKKYHLADPSSTFFSVAAYREIRARSHFGKRNVERFFSNQYEITPLIDPLLHRIRLSDSHCKDDNLLYVLMYVRYCPELLTIRFDNAKKIDPNTIAYAKQLNEKYSPYIAPKDESCIFDVALTDQQVMSLCKMYHNPPTDVDQIEAYFKQLFYSNTLKKRFLMYFNQEIYKHAKWNLEKSNFHPLRHCYAVIAITDVILAVEESQMRADEKATDRLLRLHQNSAYVQVEPNRIPDTFIPAVTARVDLLFSGEEAENMEILQTADDYSVITQPEWMQKKGIGCIVESVAGQNEVKIQIKGRGHLSIKLRGRYEKDQDGIILPLWIDYTHASLGDDILLEKPAMVCYERSVTRIVEIAEGIVALRYNWVPHTSFDISAYNRLKSHMESIKKIAGPITSRVDLLFSGEEAENMEILQAADDYSIITQPEWMQKKGIGCIVESVTGQNEVKIQIKGKGHLSIKLRGRYEKDQNGTILPLWIDYTHASLGDDILLEKPAMVCYERSVTRIVEITEGIVTLCYSWVPHTSFDIFAYNRLKSHMESIKKIANPITSRVDFQFIGEGAKSMHVLAVSDSYAKLIQPTWLQESGIGYSVESTVGTNQLKIQTTGKGILLLKMRSNFEKTQDGLPLPIWLDYTQILLNGNSLLADKAIASHDHPATFRIPTEDEIVTLDYTWRTHVVDVMEFRRLQQREQEMTKAAAAVESQVELLFIGEKSNEMYILTSDDPLATIATIKCQQNIGRCYAIKSIAGANTVHVHVKSKGKLIIKLSSRNHKNEQGSIHPHWLTYTKVTLNQKKILWRKKQVCYDYPAVYTLQVDNEIVSLHYCWAPMAALLGANAARNPSIIKE